jgi:hypothetical protein
MFAAKFLRFTFCISVYFVNLTLLEQYRITLLEIDNHVAVRFLKKEYIVLTHSLINRWGEDAGERG